MVEGNGFTKKELKEILAQHVLWLDSDGEQGRRAYLNRADLNGADLGGAILFEAELTRANLTRADLSGADLRDADLRGANLGGADLREANLNGADLRGTNLDGAELGPEIRECWRFDQARVSEDQLAWLSLHPRFSEWVDGLEIVNEGLTQ